MVDVAAAERRRSTYELLLSRLGDLVAPAFAALAAGASPLVLPIESASKPALLRHLRAVGIRALDLWSVPHPLLDREGFPRATALRRTLVGLPVHQELRRRDLERIATAVRSAPS